MKDKLLQILDEVQRTMSLCQELTQEDATKMTMGVLLLKVTKAKQLLSYPIAEQGKSAEKEKQKFCDELYFDLTQSHDKRMELIEKLWSIKIASQSPIKQEVSEEELENLA